MSDIRLLWTLIKNMAAALGPVVIGWQLHKTELGTFWVVAATTLVLINGSVDTARDYVKAHES